MNCGPKCYRWILQQEQIELTLDAARERCQTTAMGTRVPDLRAALIASGLEIELRQHLSWDELIMLARTHYVLVLYQCHYSVVINADPESLELYDPDYGRVVRRERSAFDPYWHDAEIDLDWTRRDYERAAILVKRRHTAPATVTTARTLSRVSP